MIMGTHSVTTTVPVDQRDVITDYLQQVPTVDRAQVPAGSSAPQPQARG